MSAKGTSVKQPASTTLYRDTLPGQTRTISKYKTDICKWDILQATLDHDEWFEIMSLSHHGTKCVWIIGEEARMQLKPSMYKF